MKENWDESVTGNQGAVDEQEVSNQDQAGAGGNDPHFLSHKVKENTSGSAFVVVVNFEP